MTYFETVTLAVNGISVILSPLIALWIGGILQRRSENKVQRLDLLRRIIASSHELHPNSHSRSQIVSALLEIKFWYHADREVIDSWMSFQKKLSNGISADSDLHDLLRLLARREGIMLSKAELTASLNSK